MSDKQNRNINMPPYLGANRIAFLIAFVRLGPQRAHPSARCAALPQALWQSRLFASCPQTVRPGRRQQIFPVQQAESIQALRDLPQHHQAPDCAIQTLRFFLTVSHGNSVYPRNTMPRSGPGVSTGCPAKSISPVEADLAPARILIRVDLPQPEGPITVTNSRRWTRKFTLQRRHRTVYRFKGFAKFGDLKDHIASLQFVKAGLDCLTLGEITRQFHVGHVQLITLTSSFVARPFPGKEHFAQLREYDVRQQPNNADHNDRGEYIVEILIPCLLCNEPGYTRTGTDEFCNN